MTDTISIVVSCPTQSGITANLPQAPIGFDANIDWRQTQIAPMALIDSGVAKINSSAALMAGVNLKVAIGGLDWTEATTSVDASIAIGKSMECRVGLARVLELSPSVIKAGDWATIEQFLGDKLVNHISGYVVAPPTRRGREFTVEIQGTYSQARQRIYCGEVPTTSDQLTRIYCEANGLTTKAIPQGHFLDEVVDNFTSQPISILAEVWDPSGHDVHEDFSGSITVQKTRRDIPIRHLSKDDCISIGYGQPSTKQIKELIVSNSFKRFDGYEPYKKTFELYSDNYDPANDYPFFSGGWTKSEVEITYQGDAELLRIEKVYGYTTTADVFAKDVSFSACRLDCPVPTVYGLLYTKETRVYTAQLLSGYSVVYRRDFNVNGKYAYSGTADRGGGSEPKWYIQEGQIERQVSNFVNVRQTDSTLCERDQFWATTDAAVYRWGLLDNGSYAILESVREWYSRDYQDDLSATRYYRPQVKWKKQTQKGRFDQPTGKWVVTPIVASDGNPPVAEFIRPKEVPVEVGGYFGIS